MASSSVTSATPPLAPETNCGTLLFKDLCLKFEKMLKLSKSQQKLLLIFNKELKDVLNGQSMFPLMRLLLPLNDSHRQKYGVKQTTVANTYIEALHLNKSSADASRLKFWKNPTRLNATVSKVGSGDFTSILEDVLRTRISLELSTLTLQDVNEILDELAATKDKIELIRTKILNRFSALEQKWLMRIVFQDMKIGLKYEQVLNHISPTALQRYNECTDLRLVCSEIALAKSAPVSSSSTSGGPSSQTTATRGINIFTCFYPMLAKGFPNTGQIVEVEAAMQGHPFVMDLKLDGDRMLCHISNGKGMFWSRNGTDYSATYASLLDDIVKRVNCRSCIIDGEVCAWDDENQTFIPFGHNRTVARMEDEERKLSQDRGGGRLSLEDEDDREDPNFGKRSCHLVYIMFDVIYLQDLKIDNRVVYDLSTLPFLSREALVLGYRDHASSSAPQYSKDLNESFDKFDKNHFTSDILHFPLLIRRALLPYLVNLQEKRIEIVRSEAVFSHSLIERKARLENFFNRVSVEGEEGLVVKDGFSPYLLGMRSRQSQNWVKMKPEYSDLTRDLDLIILGAYFGEGNSMRGKGLSTFLLGIRDDSDAGSSITPPSSLSSSQPSSSQVPSTMDSRPITKYRSICKVGTGYSFQELEELRSKITPYIIPWDQTDKQRLPPHFTYWRIGKSDDVPDVWIPPDKSFIVELKCAEIVTSDQFSAGITCRFPRLRKIRYDKNFTEVMTLSDIYQILKQPRLKNRVANAEEDGEGEEPSKKRGGGRKKNKLLENSLKYRENIVASHFSLPSSATPGNNSTHQSSNDSTGKSSLISLDMTSAKRKLHQSCGDRVLCVLENEYTIPSERYDVIMESRVFSKSEKDSLVELLGWTEESHQSIKLNRIEVINLILATGGEVVANPTPSCLVITGDKRTFQATGLIESGRNNVLHFRYILDLVTGSLEESDNDPKPRHFLGYTPETKGLFSEHYDCYGDSYTEHITESELDTLFFQVDNTIRNKNWDLLKDGDHLPILGTKGHKVPLKKPKRKRGESDLNEEDQALLNDLTVSSTQLERNCAELYSRIKDKSWRDIVSCELDDRESELFLDFSLENIFWRNQTIIYLDLYPDLGSIESKTSEQQNYAELYLFPTPPQGSHHHSTSAAPATTRQDEVCCHLYRSQPIPSELVEVEMMSLLPLLHSHGAIISRDLNCEVTHVVVSPNNTLRHSMIEDRIRELRYLPSYRHEKRIVTSKWVQDCIREKKILFPSTRSHHTAQLSSSSP